MQIAPHKVVTLDFILRSSDGTLIDQSAEGEPLAYIHGVGSLIPALESALAGRSQGDEIEVSLTPDEAYGERNDALVQAVPRDRFQGTDDVHVGMQFRTPTDGGEQIVTVIGFQNDLVIVDGNHPLAGETLNFTLNVRNVRDATPEEIDHGHVHGPGGHHGHGHG